MTLVDTDSLTLVYYHKPGITERVRAAPAAGPVGVTVITRIEILRGRFESVLKAATAPELMTAQDRLAEAESLLARFHTVPFDGTAAAHFDRLRVNKKLKKIGRGDLLNACIALAHDATLVTRNTKDYANIPGLKTENWAD